MWNGHRRDTHEARRLSDGHGEGVEAVLKFGNVRQQTLGQRRTDPSVSSAARAAAWASPLGFQTLPSSSLSDEDAEDDRLFVFLS